MHDYSEQPGASGPGRQGRGRFGARGAGEGHLRAHHQFGRGPGFGHGPGGPPPWKGGRRARRGDIRWALLLGLLDGPAHGYELIGRLEARTGGGWRPSPGSVYPTLQLLEDEGLVSSREEGGKRVFELTDAGRTAANKAAEGVDAGAWGAGGAAQQAGLQQAMGTLRLAARQIAVAGDDAQTAAAITVITEARQRLYRILAGDEPVGDPAPTA